MKNDKLIIGLGASIVGVIIIILIARKIKQDAALAVAAAPMKTEEIQKVDDMQPGLTDNEKALLNAYLRLKQGEGKI